MAVPKSLSQWHFIASYPFLHRLFYFPPSYLAYDRSVSVVDHNLQRANCCTVRHFSSSTTCCTCFARFSVNCAFCMRCADNPVIPLQGTGRRTKSAIDCLSRKFSGVPRHFLARHRPTDDTPGSEALFRQEMKKMKEKEYVRDDTEEETVLTKLMEHQFKREKAMKYAKRAKYLGQEKQERSLTWDNIDQIRFLRQEHPDEWSIAQLARSFEVSEQTIKKVLKSKFTPDAQTRQYQDEMAVRNVGKNMSVPPSPDTNSDHVLLDEGSNNFSRAKSKEGFEDNHRGVDFRGKNSLKGSSSKNVSKVEMKKTEELASSGGALWEEDDEIALEEELEEAEAFDSLTAADFVKVFDEGIQAPKMVQKGRDFYDSDGEFLFKI